eukprot:Sspe_Gene.119963::Locus_117391_Transcript_1_2_Confidence_0.667_Length_846::g.119963::m.119963
MSLIPASVVTVCYFLSLGAPRSHPIQIVPGITLHDAFDAVMGVIIAVLHFRCFARMEARSQMKAQLLQSVYLIGHGMHTVANGMEHARNAMPHPVNDSDVQLYFYHEVVSHNTQYIALLATYLLLATQGHALDTHGLVPAVVSILLGLSLSGIIIGTRVVPITSPFLFALLIQNRSAYFRRMAAVAVLGLLGFAFNVLVLKGYTHLATFDDLRGDSLIAPVAWARLSSSHLNLQAWSLAGLAAGTLVTLCVTSL